MEFINKALFLIVLGATFFCIPNDDWQLKKNENSIAIYTRNSEHSAFKELKAVTNLKTSLSSIVALLTNFETYPAWVYRCGKSSTLKTINEKEWIHYQTMLAPWPANNRDFVVNIKVEQNQVTKVVTIKSYSMATLIPLVPSYVRIKNINASWILTPRKDGTVEIVYQLLVDPAGSIPAWIVNMAIVDGPFETMSNMNEMILKKEYQKAKIPYIKELENVLSKK